MTDMFGFTAGDKFRCATREVLKRRQVYPRLVAEKKLSKERADQELDIMDAIAAEYARASAVGKVGAAWEGGAVLHFDIAVTIADQKEPRIVRFTVPMGIYGLRATLAETVRLIKEQPAGADHGTMPSTKEAEALLA
jgi:hypothetical protein